MKTLKHQLFPDCHTWLADSYSSLETAIVVEEYFAAYLKKSAGEKLQRQLYLELIDVEFCSPEEVPRVLIKIGYASNKLHILVPDANYSEKERDDIRTEYQLKYSPILKESHLRTNVLLWRTFSEEEQKKILADVKD